MTFAPGRSVQLSVSDVSVGAGLPAEAPLALVTNFGPAAVYIRFGTGYMAAETQYDVPILPNTQFLLTKGVGADAVAAVCDEGKTASIYITVGTGA